MKSAILVAALSLMAFADAARAELIYKYIDANGETHVVDDISTVLKSPPVQPDKPRTQPAAPVAKSAPASRQKQPAKPQPPVEQKTAGAVKVEVYQTAWCTYCRKLTRFLDEKGIPYTAYDVDKDSAAARTYKGFNVIGVPVTRVGTHIIVGYNPEEVMARINGK